MEDLLLLSFKFPLKASSGKTTGILGFTYVKESKTASYRSTPRGIELLYYLAKGYTSREIAKTLEISHRTVEKMLEIQIKIFSSIIYST